MSVVFLNSSILFATYCLFVVVGSFSRAAGESWARIRTFHTRAETSSCFVSWVFFSLFSSLAAAAADCQYNQLFLSLLGASSQYKMQTGCLLLARFSHSNDDDDKSSFFFHSLLPTPFYTRRERTDLFVSWHSMSSVCLSLRDAACSR